MESTGTVNTMNKRNTPYMNDDRASIGIGAMIVFIALILVAAVASTIIIKTAEELQQNAEQTSSDTRQQISGKIALIDVVVRQTGDELDNVDGNDDGDPHITIMDVIFRISSGSSGIYPPDFVYDHVLEQLTSFIEYTDEEHPLFTQFDRKIQEINLTDEDRSMLKDKLKNAIRTSVTPGFKLLLDFMTEKRILANKNDGVWSLPKGDDYYELRIREYTTTDYTPEQIHQMGLDEVNRISKRMSEILADLGYDANKNVGEIMNALNENPKFLYADTPDRKEIVISDYTEMVNEAIEVMTDYFYSMPKSPVIVKAVPEYSEKTAAGGYYQAPALDGSRPGVFYANLYDIKQTPTYSMRTLTYHEATPGHHHQIAHSLENEDLTLYRRFGYGTSAFSEGWALYAERLALEAGLAENPYDELGILQSEIFRAVRLVVDTGLHYKKWTREEAMEYMKAITGMSDTEVRVEIERYIVWPGQALSYKVGMIKILELREKAKTLGLKVRNF